jgi:hypothetical protein
MTTDRHYFIEQHGHGKFAVRAKGSEQASRLCNTQKQAEAVVKTLNPDDKPNVGGYEISRLATAARRRCPGR